MEKMIGSRQRRNAFILAISHNGRVPAGFRIPVNHQSPRRGIGPPVFHDTGARIKHGFDRKIELQRTIRNLNHQKKIFRQWVGVKGIRIAVKNNKIWLRFVPGALRRIYVNGRFRVHKLPAKGPQKPELHPCKCLDMRSIFAHLTDQFSIDKLKLLLLK